MKIYVGMSGGVDSSLAAALLKEQGHDITGVYMKNWTQDLPGLRCPWADDLADAKRVAVQLNIPFKVFDFQKEYKQKVVDYMIAGYQAGRTPNPDIMCNQEVKFKLFLDAATLNGAEYIATGHYARVMKHEARSTKQGEPTHTPYSIPHTSRAGLLTAKDNQKDQTYFLYRITSGALAHTLFPLGNLKKSEVRAMATKRKLYTADKKDSQGICFVGKVGIKDFLSQYVDAKPGPIIDASSGAEIGQHDGAIFYTIGQRHGLDVGGGMPYYVVNKDMKKNEVYVTTDLNNENLWLDQLEISDLHWINKKPDLKKTYQARLRYRAPLIDVTLEPLGQNLRLHLAEPERAITPGQSAVIYDGPVCLGGGIVTLES